MFYEFKTWSFWSWFKFSITLWFTAEWAKRRALTTDKDLLLPWPITQIPFTPSNKAPPCSAWSNLFFILRRLLFKKAEPTFPRLPLGSSDLKISNKTPPTDSRNFNNILPVKPSQTTTSKLPESTSRPSQLPPKSKLFSLDSSSNVLSDNSLPLHSSSPIFKRPIPVSYTHLTLPTSVTV